MDNNRKLAHIVAYYLSRFDKIVLSKLRYKTDKDAFHKIAEALSVLPNYIKFKCNEFDVAHPYRKGWHKFTDNHSGELDRIIYTNPKD